MGELDRVGDQVDHYLFETHGIHFVVVVAVNFVDEANFYLFLVGLRLHQARDFLEQLLDAVGLVTELEFAVLGAGAVEEIAHLETHKGDAVDDEFGLDADEVVFHFIANGGCKGKHTV